MFDIDGTLTQTCAADSECFVHAVSERLGLAHVSSDWTQYQHVTDSGIAAEIIEKSFARAPAEGELDRICNRFVNLLEKRFDTDESLCRPIAGAAQLLAFLRSRSDVAIALATGGWARSATLKLRKANIGAEGAAFASANDSYSRQESCSSPGAGRQRSIVSMILIPSSTSAMPFGIGSPVKVWESL